MGEMESKELLEIKLLKAQVVNLEFENKRWLIRAILPSILAIIFSIVASGVVIVIGNTVVNDSITKLNEVKTKIKLEKEIFDNLTIKNKTLNELNSSMIGKTMLYDLGIDFDINIEKTGHAIVIHALTDSADVKFRCYQMCMNNFVFPGGAPNTSVCNEIEGSCSQNKTKYHYEFGPFVISGLEEGVWVSAELKGKVIYRYINIKSS